MNNRNITKKVAKFVIGTSAGYTITSALTNNATSDTAIHTAEVFVGGMALGAMVAESTEDWTDRKVDDLFDWIETFKKN